MKSLTASLSALVLILSNCATTPGEMEVTYLSDPPNAALYQADTNMQIGRAPQKVTYPISKEQNALGKLTLPSVTARWPSGANSSTGSIEAFVNAGTAQEFTLIRPVGAPGADIDAKFAVDFASNRISVERNEILKAANGMDSKLTDEQ